MAEHASVIRVAHFSVAADKRDQLVSKLEPIAEQIRQMEGCFGMQICRVRDSADEVAAVSRWANQAALDKMTQSGVQNNPEIRGMLSGDPRVEHFEPI